MSAVPAPPAGNGARLSVVGAGRVGQTLAHLLVQKLGLRAHQVFCRQPVHAEEAAAFIGPGKALSHFAVLSASDIWLIGVPDSAIESTAKALAEQAQRLGWPPAIAFHCSGFCASDKLAALQQLGWSVASVHPALNFANPAQAVRQFSGTLCGIEGDETAARWLNEAMAAIGGQVFSLDASTKVLYHAAAVFCSNFTIALQDMAQQAWRSAGLPDEVIAPLNRQLLETSVRNALALGPPQAITGPAARGDAQTVQTQMQAVSDWSADAGHIYQLLSEAAYRLAQQGNSLAPGPGLLQRPSP